MSMFAFALPAWKESMKSPLALTVLVLLIALTIVLPAFGSTVGAVSIEQLSNEAEMIFEGEVVRSESMFDPDQMTLHTYVTFRIDDIVKGSYAAPEITLRFLGGTVGETGMHISDSTLPAAGDQGIYFVESLSRYQVNPFYGMDQGHFLILDSNGERVMMTSNRRIITSFLPDEPELNGRISNGLALGLSVDAATDSSAVTTLQFKEKIREYLEGTP